ncbi:hypothetical protein Ami103574_04210 [Aminipila butyrica]|uniref:Uncharacterized protein n=1 Tax=Aminipila butyrica TaxID=433296 RepID=A0A858BUX0_9FIRM|nr:hypothetical protein [Aminipila butyrica]QIB68574.1 hypothetical protein Ami103574_04210 [Aminipila butyrica]
MKKYLSYVLALALLVSCAVIPLDTVSAETGPMKYWLDMGVQQVWSNPDGSWDGQVKQGDSIDVTSTIGFSAPVEIVGYYTVESSNFNFEDKSGTYNYNKSKLIFDEASYQRSYGQYKSTQITPVSATASGNNVTISYKAKLENSGEVFNLAKQLRLPENLTGDKLWTLLGSGGGKDNVKKYSPAIYDKWQKAYDEGLGDTIQAYLYFTPTVIAYREILPDIPEAPQAVPPADTKGSCTDVIKWSETKSHTYTVGSGENKKTRTCNHVYTYQSKLSSSATLTAAKPNGNNTTFKSGYGFSVNVNNSIATSQIGNSGACGKSLSKANNKKPVPPSAAEVRTSGTVKVKGAKATQPKNVALAKGATTGTTSKFITAANPLSQYKKAQIYTDVALKGTKQKPVKHSVTAYTYGGGVNGVQFCKSIPLTFTINGNMYEDDWTVDRVPK